MARKQRLDPAIFHLPVEKMREGYYSDKYFVRTRELLLKDDHRPCVTMQVFGKSHAFLGGIDEAIAILKLCSMEWPELEVYCTSVTEQWATVAVGVTGLVLLFAMARFIPRLPGCTVSFITDCPQTG